MAYMYAWKSPEISFLLVSTPSSARYAFQKGRIWRARVASSQMDLDTFADYFSR